MTIGQYLALTRRQVMEIVLCQRDEQGRPHIENEDVGDPMALVAARHGLPPLLAKEWAARARMRKGK